MGWGMPRVDSGMPFFFKVFLGVIIAFFAVALISALRQWRKDNRSPVLVIEAVVVSKRQDTSGSGEGRITTWHYATFEAETGSRMEFALSGSEYGMLAEGDKGRLTFQGTRYLGFQRH